MGTSPGEPLSRNRTVLRDACLVVPISWGVGVILIAAVARVRVMSMRWLVAHRRAVGVSALVAGVAGLVTYLVVAVPVASAPINGRHELFFCPLWAPPVSRSQATLHWWGALVAAIFVMLVDTLVLLAYRRGRRGARREPATSGQRPPAPTLRLQRVPVHVAGISAAASALLVFAAAMQGYALWVIALFGLAPWLPLVASEVVWKYERYGAWALFGVVVMLQLGHMGEHSVQVLQLLFSGGQLAQSHGIFGQLDFETVHFIWDSAIWLSLCLLLRPFASGNRWLWVAFAAASFHEVEHVYLFWIYHAHPAFYAAGGFEGIMGYDGVIGSPLARPYLHFVYNFHVILPMALAFWDETKRAQREWPENASRRELAIGAPIPT